MLKHIGHRGSWSQQRRGQGPSAPGHGITSTELMAAFLADEGNFFYRLRISFANKMYKWNYFRSIFTCGLMVKPQYYAKKGFHAQWETLKASPLPCKYTRWHVYTAKYMIYFLNIFKYHKCCESLELCTFNRSGGFLERTQRELVWMQTSRVLEAVSKKFGLDLVCQGP